MNFKSANQISRKLVYSILYIYKDTLCTSIFFRAKMNKSSFDQCRFENTSFKRIERYEVSKVHRADAVWLHLDNNNLRWFFFSPRIFHETSTINIIRFYRFSSFQNSMKFFEYTFRANRLIYNESRLNRSVIINTLSIKFTHSPSISAMSLKSLKE